MIRFRCVLPSVVVLGAVVAGCSAAPAATPPSAPAATTAPAPAGVPTAAPDASGVRTIFAAYYAALGGRDFDAACAMNAPETNEALVRNVTAGGLQASTCAEALTRIYAVPSAAATVDEIVRSAQVGAVDVEGEKATVTWSATSQGQQRTVRSAMRLVEGQWRLVDTGSR